MVLLRNLGRLLLALLPCAGIFLSCGEGGLFRASRTDTPGEEEAIVLPPCIDGNYSMKITGGEKAHYATATVTEIAEGQYQISRITVYGPVLYGFTLLQNGQVVSEELGHGTVSYKEKIDKTTIRFEREDSICELTR